MRNANQKVKIIWLTPTSIWCSWASRPWLKMTSMTKRVKVTTIKVAKSISTRWKATASYTDSYVITTTRHSPRRSKKYVELHKSLRRDGNLRDAMEMIYMITILHLWMLKERWNLHSRIIKENPNRLPGMPAYQIESHLGSRLESLEKENHKWIKKKKIARWIWCWNKTRGISQA